MIYNIYKSKYLNNIQNTHIKTTHMDIIMILIYYYL